MECIVIEREMDFYTPGIAQSRAMNRKDTPEAFYYHKIRMMREVFYEFISEMVLEIESKPNVYRNFSTDLLKELNEYIISTCEFLNKQGVRVYSKDNVAKTLISEKNKNE